MKESGKKYSEGHFIGKWTAIGTAIFAGCGFPLGILTGNKVFFAIGPAIGVAFGTAVGIAVKAKHKKNGEVVPLSQEEKKTQKVLLLCGVAVFIVGLGVMLFRSNT